MDSSNLPPAVLKIKAVDRGVVVIQGTETGKYLAMNDEGCLYSSVSIHPGEHLWVENTMGNITDIDVCI